MNREPLTTGEIAQYCHVTYRAVLKWIKEGKLKAYRTPGKHSRVDISDFIDFLSKYDMPIPPEFDPAKWKKRVLIVDDDKKVVDMVRTGLMLDKRFKCEVAYDGFAAGEKFADFAPDLIILDINMPGLNGYEVCTHIRHNLKNKDVRILTVTGMTGGEESKKMMRLGANDRLEKPFQMGALMKKIEKLLGLKEADGQEDIIETYRRSS